MHLDGAFFHSNTAKSAWNKEKNNPRILTAQ